MNKLLQNKREKNAQSQTHCKPDNHQQTITTVTMTITIKQPLAQLN